MTKSTVATNLLGRTVTVTMGLNDAEIAGELERRQQGMAAAGNRGTRRIFNERGEITAVYKNQTAICFVLAMESGGLEEVFASHCRILPPESLAVAESADKGGLRATHCHRTAAVSPQRCDIQR